MTGNTKTSWTEIGGGVLLILAALVGIQACNLGNPVATDEGSSDRMSVAEQPGVATSERSPSASAEPPPANESVVRLREVPQQVGEFSASEQVRSDLSAEPTFTPMTHRPEIVNRTDVMAAMEREYPPLLREAGIGGTVRVHFFITEEGDVGRALIAESSGHRALDEAALRVADAYRFSPARNGEALVPVWVQFGITFRSR